MYIHAVAFLTAMNWYFLRVEGKGWRHLWKNPAHQMPPIWNTWHMPCLSDMYDHISCMIIHVSCVIFDSFLLLLYPILITWICEIKSKARQHKMYLSVQSLRCKPCTVQGLHCASVNVAKPDCAVNYLVTFAMMHCSPHWIALHWIQACIDLNCIENFVLSASQHPFSGLHSFTPQILSQTSLSVNNSLILPSFQEILDFVTSAYC